MTLIWLVIWLASNTIGDREALSSDSVNVWAGTLLLVVALDLGRQHTSGLSRPRAGRQEGK